MRKVSYVALTAALLAVIIYLCSCASGGGVIDTTDPILPSPEIKEGVVDPDTRAITITKDNVSLTMEHWSKTRLNRKYTTVDMRSPFYFLESWDQALRTEAFYLTIKNDTPRKVIVTFKESICEDDREYKYKPLEINDFKYKFTIRKMLDLKTKRGLELARRILLNEVLGPKREVPAGKSRSGFLAYPAPSTGAEKVWVTVVLEKEPELATGAYERAEFRFDYIQDRVLRAREPATQR